MTGGGVWQGHPTGGKTKYQGPQVRLQGTGSEDGGTGARGVQSSSMQQIMLVYDEVRRLETGAGHQQVGRIGWLRRGGAADVTHDN